MKHVATGHRICYNIIAIVCLNTSLNATSMHTSHAKSSPLTQSLLPSLDSNTPLPHSPVPFHCYYGIRRGVEPCFLLQIMSLACCRYTIRPVRQVVKWARRAESRCLHEGSIWCWTDTGIWLLHVRRHGKDQNRGFATILPRSMIIVVG